MEDNHLFNDTDRHHEPHYHIRSHEGRAVVRIKDNVVLVTEVPERDLRPALEWAKTNYTTLVSEWNRCNPDRPI
jgi:hypothetical protein